MQELRPKIKTAIKFIITVVVLTLVIIIISLLMLKYAVEGENNMPFEITELIVVSTAEGIDKGEGENTWNFDLAQNNDMYLHISKNKNYKEEEIIKNIKLDNFKINNGPNLGKITIYRPSKDAGHVYEYKDEYIIENEINYAGSELPNAKNLEIANQGGIILLRFCNKDLRRILIK